MQKRVNRAAVTRILTKSRSNKRYMLPVDFDTAANNAKPSGPRSIPHSELRQAGVQYAADGWIEEAPAVPAVSEDAEDSVLPGGGGNSPDTPDHSQHSQGSAAGTTTHAPARGRQAKADHRVRRSPDIIVGADIPAMQIDTVDLAFPPEALREHDDHYSSLIEALFSPGPDASDAAPEPKARTYNLAFLGFSPRLYRFICSVRHEEGPPGSSP
ncbi:hypothetical protein BP00DRAFT_481769 [Aspergillus indologenus CBS 114.80]|uniref:Uncharacterized protein n=1 Tax=Aspergillus indologenus CBS 114.80 TaxID=1450541 RepID=A0A2V5HUQ5_9EURO|nr:hypothetical protein BP00DRAFT_481769 [Aspergillus indologenus CBS 114.80]